MNESVNINRFIFQAFLDALLHCELSDERFIKETIDLTFGSLSNYENVSEKTSDPRSEAVCCQGENGHTVDEYDKYNCDTKVAVSSTKMSVRLRSPDGFKKKSYFTRKGIDAIKRKTYLTDVREAKWVSCDGKLKCPMDGCERKFSNRKGGYHHYESVHIGKAGFQLKVELDKKNLTSSDY